MDVVIGDFTLAYYVSGLMLCFELPDSTSLGIEGTFLIFDLFAVDTAISEVGACLLIKFLWLSLRCSTVSSKSSPN